MPAPIEPKREAEATSPPSARSDVDETVATSDKSSPGGLAPPGFGQPAAHGEVGTLGPYRVVKELGRGGMGAVYAALDTRLERRLALKVMLPEFAADASAKERFLREARAAARIKHDNVVTVYEADERQGVPYIAMEFLEGYPLDEYLKKRGTPTIPQVLRIAAETAAGLAAAHRIGLVHRDIKPGNLWLEAPHGRVKVLDFGLAKPVDAEVELTKSGAVVGTPAYMSPEQARGEKVDHRTDLFSLGSVMYRLCTGRLPFHGPTTMAVLMALGTEEPLPVREANPAVPESLAALIHQLLAKRVDERPQSAAEVVKRIRAIAEELAAPRALPVEQSTSQPQVMQPQIVYAAMPVTAAPPAENPFADLDSPATEAASREVAAPSPEPAKPKPTRAKPGGKWPWLLAGLAALLALAVAGGVIIVIKNKDGSETKIEVPDGATVTVKDKNGKTLAQVGPGGRPPAADTSPDRKAAEYVLSIGGTARVNGEGRDIKAAADLPKERFTLTGVSLANAKVVDAELANLKDLKGLTYLDLNTTKVTNAGLAHLAGLGGLRELYLAGTLMSDDGLKHLKGFNTLKVLRLDNTQVSNAGLAQLRAHKELTSLNLNNTKVTDEGVEHLKELKGLALLSLGGTKVTAKGLEMFHAAVPGCRIEHDGGVIEAVDVDRKAAEWVLSLGGAVQVNGENRNIKAAADLPKDRFTLTAASLNNTAVTDDGLANLRHLNGLMSINLDGTRVTGAGLAQLKPLASLKAIDLRNTPVSDDGLAHLKDLKALAHLYLGGTKVTDAGLTHLRECKSLVLLHVLDTKVTPKGTAEFHAAVPGCRIEHDSGTIEAVDMDRKAAEYVLSLGGVVRVNGGGDINAAPELPKERFILTYVHLYGSQVTDAGLAHFKDCKGLIGLHLGGTQVTDAGLAKLKDCRALTSLDVRQTKVTAKGLAEFHASLPACRIEHDGGAIEPKK